MMPWRLRAVRVWVKATSLPALLYIFCIGFLVLAELLLPIKEHVSPIWILLLIVCSACLGFAALVIDHSSDIACAWKSPFTKMAIAFVTFWISAYSLSFADDMIVQYTLLSPAKFSRAQTLLASVIAPILWVAVFAFVFAALYILHAFLMIRRILLSSKRFMRFKPYRILRVVFSLPTKPTQEPNTILEVGKLVALALMTVVITPMLLRIVSSSEVIDRPFRQLFVMSSFYSNNGACRNLPNTDKISIFEDGKALHVSDEISLSFHIVECR